jgi:hypothetical protein
MIIFTLFGMDKDGQAYSFSNETPEWTLRGSRRDSQCFGLCEISIYDGERKRHGVVYAWNPIDGYTYDPSGDYARYYSSIGTQQVADNELEEEIPPTPRW